MKIRLLSAALLGLSSCTAYCWDFTGGWQDNPDGSATLRGQITISGDDQMRAYAAKGNPCDTPGYPSAGGLAGLVGVLDTGEATLFGFIASPFMYGANSGPTCAQWDNGYTAPLSWFANGLTPAGKYPVIKNINSTLTAEQLQGVVAIYECAFITAGGNGIANWEQYAKNWALSGSPNCTPTGLIPPPVPTPSCKVNGGGDINVDFGQIERSDIGTTAGGGLARTKTFTITCDGSDTQNFTVKMNMSPANWNSNAIQSSNKDVGVITQWEGSAMGNGTSQSMAVNGSASATLTFTPVRWANWSTDDIATGVFNASATLVVTQQ